MITVDKGQNRTLTLEDAKNPGSWEEGSYQVAGSATPLQAIALKVSCYDTLDKSTTVEYRFANTQGRIQVSVAQDLNSDSSDNVLEFSLVADGRRVDTKTVKLKEQKTLSTTLTGVTALKIGVKSVQTSGCTDTSTALITSVKVTG